MAEKSVTKNAVLNVSRQICNIIIPLITFPYVSRVLTASNLGKYSFSDSVTGIAMVFASLGIETYAVREGARIRNDKKKITKFVSEVYSISLLSMTFALVGLFLLTIFVPRLHRNFILTYILSINIITYIVGRDWINNIYEDFEYITIRYIVFQLIAIACIFLFVRKPGDYIVYTIITVIGNSGGYILNIFYTKKYIPLHITHKLNLKRHLKPMLYLFGVALAIKIYIQADITVLGFFRSDGEVGIYTIASKVYTIVKALLNAVIMAIIPRLSNYLGANDKKNYDFLLNKLRTALYTLVFPAVVGLAFESGNVMRLIGGDDYVNGISALQILCLALAFSVFGCFYSQGVLVPNRKDKTFFIATVVSALTNVALNILVIPRLGMNGAAMTTVLAEFIVMIICDKKSRKFIFSKVSKRVFFSVFIGCIGVAFFCLISNVLISNYIIELIVSIISSVLSYGILGISFKNPIIHEGLLFFKSKIERK